MYEKKTVLKLQKAEILYLAAARKAGDAQLIKHILYCSSEKEKSSYFVKNFLISKKAVQTDCFLLSMGDKKDIFVTFCFGLNCRTLITPKGVYIIHNLLRDIIIAKEDTACG